MKFREPYHSNHVITHRVIAQCIKWIGHQNMYFLSRLTPETDPAPCFEYKQMLPTLSLNDNILLSGLLNECHRPRLHDEVLNY